MKSVTGRLTHALFGEQAVRTPDAVAVVAGTRRTTYRELDAMANGVAQRLAAEGIGRGALVGVCLERDERLIAALLGVFKSGAAYVPLDPAYPVERLRVIHEDAGPARVITAKKHHDLVSDTGALPLLLEEITPAGAPPPGAGPTAADAAYVIYTSGSTGRPKGVVIEHGSSAGFVQWAASTMDAAELGGSLAALSVCFDVSIMEIFPPLVSGGTVVMAPSLLDLPTLPARDEVTVVTGPPSGLLALLHQGLPPNVRTVVAAGEALTPALVEALFAQPGVERVRNGYGPTEATTLSHCHDIYRASYVPGEAVPIGVPVAGAQGLILDSGGRPVPEGEVGELWLAGPGVARGYLNRPELTAERFVSDPGVAGGRRYRTGDLAWQAGRLFRYAGRIDDQVKIRGFRVELGEVEAALTGHPDVRGAVALAPADRDGVRTLYAYAQAAPGKAVTEGALRGYLKERLPAYLVPSRIAVIETIPLGPTGKADRSALPPIAAAARSGEAVSARTGQEAAIAAVFADVLGVPAVGVHDGFFDLGGHSLGAALAVARISERLGTTVPLAWLLAEPTVAGLAARVEVGGEQEPRATRHAGQPAFPLTGMQWNLWMSPQMYPGSTNTIALEFRLRGIEEAASVQAALDGIVRRHEVLRTTVAKQGDRPVAMVQPPAPVPLTVVGSPAEPRDPSDQELTAAIDAAARHRFDLGADVPLLRATLVWTAAGRARLIVAVDHFGFDGYSIGLFAQELAAGIAADGKADAVPEPAVQVGDVAMLQMELGQRRQLEDMRDFWRAELTGANSPNLPGTLREKGPSLGKRLVHRLDSAAEARLRSLEAACGATRFTVFATALGVALYRITGKADNLIGTLIALRDRPGLDRVIGPLVDMVPVRVRTLDSASFRALTASVAAASNRALANRDLGIVGIIGCAEPDRPAGLPLTPIVLSMQPATVPVVVDSGPVRVELSGELDPGGAMCDIAVLVNATADGLELQLMYDTERFAAQEVESFLRQLLDVLDTAAADPDRAVAAAKVG